MPSGGFDQFLYSLGIENTSNRRRTFCRFVNDVFGVCSSGGNIYASPPHQIYKDNNTATTVQTSTIHSQEYNLEPRSMSKSRSRSQHRSKSRPRQNARSSSRHRSSRVQSTSTSRPPYNLTALGNTHINRENTEIEVMDCHRDDISAISAGTLEEMATLKERKELMKAQLLLQKKLEDRVLSPLNKPQSFPKSPSPTAGRKTGFFDKENVSSGLSHSSIPEPPSSTKVKRLVQTFDMDSSYTVNSDQKSNIIYSNGLLHNEAEI